MAHGGKRRNNKGEKSSVESERHRMGGALAFHVQCFTVYSVFIGNLMFCGGGAASLLCRSCRFKGVNIPNKKKKKGVKPKTSVQVRRGGNCYRFGTLQAKIVKTSACNVAVCLGRAAGVLRPSYNRRGKSLLHHIAPSESLLSVFIGRGINKHAHRQSVVHTIRPSSLGDPASFKHSLLFCFLTRVIRR